jgi:hypothetical protein
MADPVPQITLPDVLVTPDQKSAQTPQGETPQSAKTYAGTIHDGTQGTVNGAGLPSKVLPTDVAASFRIAGHAGVPLTASPPTYNLPEEEPDNKPVVGDLSAEDRGAYADALRAGEVQSPSDYAERYSGALLGATNDATPPADDDETAARAAAVTGLASGLAAKLPNQEDLIDHAIAVATEAHVPLTPGMIAIVKDNMLDHWADTGEPPNAAYARASRDPVFADELTQPKYAPLTPEQWAATPPEPSTAPAFDPTGGPTSMQPLGSDPVRIALDIAGSGLGRFTENYEAHEARMKELGATGDPLKDLANPALDEERMNNPFLQAFGVANINEVVANSILKMFSTPEWWAAHLESAAGKKAVQGSIVKQTGMAQREKDVASARMEEFRKLVNKHVPDYAKWLRDKGASLAANEKLRQTWLKAGGDPAKFSQINPLPASPPNLIHDLIQYIEGRSTGAKLDPKSPFAPVADAMRDIYQSVRADIEAVKPDMSFIEDYYRHMWANPRLTDRIFGTGRQGNSSSLNLRSIPTLADGIDRGMVPRILDPIDNLLHYVSGMRDYLAAERVRLAGRDNGQIKYTRDGLPPEPGWLKLKGRASELHTVITDKDGNAHTMTQQAWAPPGYAKSYNNWVSKGFYEWPAVGAVYDKLMQVSNTLLALKLSLSGYHVYNIAKETVWAGMTKAFGEFGHGNMVQGLRDMGMLATVPATLPFKFGQAAGGTLTKFQQQYLRIADHGPDMERLVDLFAKSGGRAVGRGVEYHVGQMANFWTAFQRGSLKYELAQRVRDVIPHREDTIGRALIEGALTGPRLANAFIQEIGRTMETVMAPLFEHIIPQVKTSAWADEMEMFLRNNPLADEGQLLDHGRALQRSMDDRFGEFVQDNLFWNRYLKQTLNLLSVSVGWEYGTLRAFGGAAKDITSGANAFSTRARWLYAFPVMLGLEGAAYQYLKTGWSLGAGRPGIGSTALDALAPLTGGSTPEGAHERVMTPGQQKDPLKWFRLLSEAPDPVAGTLGVAGELAQSDLNPLAHILLGGLTGKDSLGNPIRSRLTDSRGQVPGWMADYEKFVLKEMEPIATGQPRLKGSALTELERYIGIRPAPEFIQNPARVQLGIQKHELYEKRMEQSRQRTILRRQQ